MAVRGFQDWNTTLKHKDYVPSTATLSLPSLPANGGHPSQLSVGYLLDQLRFRRFRPWPTVFFPPYFRTRSTWKQSHDAHTGDSIQRDACALRGCARTKPLTHHSRGLVYQASGSESRRSLGVRLQHQTCVPGYGISHFCVPLCD